VLIQRLGWLFRETAGCLDCETFQYSAKLKQNTLRKYLLHINEHRLVHKMLNRQIYNTLCFLLQFVANPIIGNLTESRKTTQ
jgi:hypothetical protein